MICICICAISRAQTYFYICLVNMWHLNIFRYWFGKLFVIQIYSDICLGPWYDIRSSLQVSLENAMCQNDFKLFPGHSLNGGLPSFQCYDLKSSLYYLL